MVASSAFAYIAGDDKGKPERDCYVGLEGYTVDDQSPFGKKGKPAIQCTDCDPACDLDGDPSPNGSCTFNIAVRINDAGVDGCTPIELKKVKGTAKAKGTKIKFFTSTPPVLDGSSVTSAFVNFPVPVKKFGKPKVKAGKGTLTVIAKKPTDKDKFTFVCNPLPEGDTCPGATTTTTTMGGTTTTTMMDCAPPSGGDPTVVQFTNELGTDDCGGAFQDPMTSEGVWANGNPPYTGEIQDGAGAKLGDLGLSCLYLGGGIAFTVPPGGNPDGATNSYDVTGVCPDGTLQLGEGAGSSLKDCTQGPNSNTTCVNILPATTACVEDADCGPLSAGACTAEANCFFGTPLPIANGGLSTCVINAIMSGAGGTVDPATGEAALAMPLQSRVYLSGNAAFPCPTCIGNTCDPNWRAGADPSPNAGDSCTTTATRGETHDCLPAGTFVGVIPVDLTPLSTGVTMLESTDGVFCPGQTVPPTSSTGVAGAFGLLDARKIMQTGVPGGDMSGGSANVTIGSTFCIPLTGNGLIDGSADLPGPGSTSLKGVLELL